MYALLRAIAGVALRWYYRDIDVRGLDRIPRRAPLLLVVNHPNALVDALLVGWILPRRMLITAKATLFENPVASRLLRWLDVIPLQRTADVRAVGAPAPSSRNRDSFRAVHHALAMGGAVLIFPEGRSHDEPSLAPLKTGAARMALEAADGAAPDVALVPIGLTFERKEAPRSRVLVDVGTPILVRDWKAQQDGGGATAAALTSEIDARLRALTANYATADAAARMARLAATIASLFAETPSLGDADRQLSQDVAIARRIAARAAQRPDTSATWGRADALVARLDAVQRRVSSHGVLIEDVGISIEASAGLRFALREGWLVVVGGPVALWGRLNHWLPFHAARAVAMRSVDSAADPAMRTLVAGTAFVLVAYMAQAAIVVALLGPWVAGGYLISLPVAADINFALSERMRRAARRARAYLLFRRAPDLQRRLLLELRELRRDVLALDQLLGEPGSTGSA